MKKGLILLCVAVLLASCAAPPGQAVPVQAEVLQAQSFPQVISEVEREPPAAASEEPAEMDEDEPDDRIETVYEPDGELTDEELVEAYFEQQYLAYTNLVNIDISSIMNMKNGAIRNMLRWSEALIQRRRLLDESGLCHVDVEKLPYTIEYEEAEDDRMELWEEWLAETGTDVVHFRIRGEPGRAYPPIMAINSQHSLFFKEVGGQKKITLHYFPGSIRKFTNSGTVTVPNEEDMVEQLEHEFGWYDTDPPEAPPDSLVYDGDMAAEYAFLHAENRNPDFYNIIDWVGNCANFVSQCVSAGFGGEMAATGEWSGGDGGTPAWENVNYFWDYITESGELNGYQLENAGELRKGDIVQTRSASLKSESERFNHMMIVVDEETLLLAQNSPDCFVYYSDLVNVETRLIRPTFLLPA